MNLKNKNILIISPEPWSHIFVSKHHYAIQLGERGNRVFFLNPPGNLERVSVTRFKKVQEVDYRGFPRGLRFYPPLLRHAVMSQTYAKLERICAAKFDLIWSFDNSVFFDFSALPAGVLKFSHIVDHNQDFETRIAASTADFCFCNTEAIKERLLGYNQRVFKINHGYSPSVEAVQTPEKPIRRDRIRAVYAGNLAIGYIDWCVFAAVVTRFPEVDFEFIGPDLPKGPRHPQYEAAKLQVMRMENVRCTGPVDASTLAGYYRAADVLMVAYQEKYQRNQAANTHKMMEYLGSGKVIVSTFTPEYENIPELIVMSSSNAEWPQCFGEVINRLNEFNSPEVQHRRIQFALQNSYEEQIKRIEEIIEQGRS